MAESEPGRLRVGGTYGAVAFLAGFVATTLLEWPAENAPMLEVTYFDEVTLLTYGDIVGSGGSPPSSYVVAGWLYHRAHLGRVDANGLSSAFDGGEEGVVLVAEPSLWLYLVPLFVVAAAGYLAARQLPAEAPRDAALNGASVALGYGALALASLGFLTWSGSIPEVGGGVVVQPDTLFTVVVTGSLYPLVVGGLGGRLSRWRATPDETESGAGPDRSGAA